MRRLSVLFAACVMFLFCSTGLASAQTMMLEYDGGVHEYSGEVYALVVNNRVLNPPLSPIIFNDRALVPVREIFEEVGATVNYIGDTQTVEVFGDDTYIRMRINDNVAYINGDKTNIPDNVVPKLIAKEGGETKTMVPVRFISETIGLDVDFSLDDGAILIDSDGYTLSDDNQAPNVDEVIVPAPVEDNNVSEPEPTAEPAPVPTWHITDVSYEVFDKQNLKVTVTADGDIEDYSDFLLTSPERVVVDIPKMRHKSINDVMTVGQAGVTSIRLGDSDERARIVVDVTNLKTYTVTQTDTNTLEIDIATKGESASTSAPAVAATPVPTKKPAGSTSRPSGTKLIVLDAGHGGTDPGAIGYLNGNEVMEKNLTLQITYKVKKILEDAGYTVSMTRTGDTLPSLAERPAQANAEDAAVFVSIHINSVDNAPDANGTEVWYSEENNGSAYGTTSEKLATNILNRMLYYMGSTNRGVKTANHAVTRRCEMPAALAEVGFITNPIEVYNMTTDEYQQKAAQGIAEGIMITLKDITVPQN